MTIEDKKLLEHYNTIADACRDFVVWYNYMDKRGIKREKLTVPLFNISAGFLQLLETSTGENQWELELLAEAGDRLADRIKDVAEKEDNKND